MSQEPQAGDIFVWYYSDQVTVREGYGDCGSYPLAMVLRRGDVGLTFEEFCDVTEYDEAAFRRHEDNLVKAIRKAGTDYVFTSNIHSTGKPFDLEVDLTDPKNEVESCYVALEEDFFEDKGIRVIRYDC